MTMTSASPSRRVLEILLGFSLLAALQFAPPAQALDILPKIFKQQVINSEIWREQEQYVALAPQDDGAAPNQHPANLDAGDLRDALRGLQVWEGGGLLHDEHAGPLLTKAQADLLGRYVAEALARAKPGEDVIFVARGYADIALDTLKERQWTSGRLFYAGGKLNLIIGAYQIKKDRGVRNAEAAYGVLNDYSDLKFDTGNRSSSTSKMNGRVVNTAGVTLADSSEGGRKDWLVIDLAKAAKGYRDGMVPEEEKKRENQAQQEAARLTLERREMREEMARLRQELKNLKSGGGATRQSPEERLKTLQDLKAKNLITDEEYQKRRAQILGEL